MRGSRGGALIVALLMLLGAEITWAQASNRDKTGPAATSNREKAKKSKKRWRPEPPPKTADHAEDPRVEEAMRTAPPVPKGCPSYRGRSKAIKSARHILKAVPTFINFRATIALATWRVDPAFEWRVRPTQQCFADLRAQKVRFRRFDPESAEGGGGEESDEPEDVEPTPAPVFLKSPVNGVRYGLGRGNGILISCELASRLHVLSEILSRNGVDQAIVISAYRPRPRPSFHTMGLALDISRFHLREPLPNRQGELSPWLTIFSDFMETPDQETCDPSLLGPSSGHGKNERGRRLLQIACDLHDSGVFASVLTPNYNPGHRDHFHIDVRPDDPRVFLR